MTERLRRLAPWVRWTDIAVVALLLVPVILGTAHVDREAGDRAADALAFMCGVVGIVALLLWRRFAVAMVAIVAVTSAVYIARDYAGGPALLPGPLALLALGYTTPRRTGWLGAAGYVVTVAVGNVVASGGLSIELVILPGWASAAVLAGQALAARGERAAAARERVAHAHERAVAAERMRIAQDLHDSVAHAMSTINVQSGVAAHLLDRDPNQAKGALEAIRAASGQALDELGAILGVLRDPDTAAPRSPVGRLNDVATLVERARADGLSVTATIDGDPAAVPPTIGAAAYRVVQEALTNVRRHAGAGATATVSVAVGDDGAVELRVTDDGRGGGPGPAGNGFGLVGMRERVESTGGELRAGALPIGGFEVVATWSRS